MSNKPILFLLMGLIFFLLSANFYVLNSPKFSREVQARYHEKLASQFSPGSVQAKRFQAIANALRKGETTYYFSATRIPSLSP